MSDHHDHHSAGGAHAPHAPPTSFLRKYVFSTDHKVIGLQFTFTSLLFVILGGLLALGVRYELAWPGQNVPHKALLPGNMTAAAPEANLAHWRPGSEVLLTKAIEHDGRTIPAGAKATLAGFVGGLPVTIPALTQVQATGGSPRILASGTEIRGTVNPAAVMGDYQYKPPGGNYTARAIVGTVVTVPADSGGDGPPEQQLTLLGRQVHLTSATGADLREVDTATPLLLPIRAADAQVALDILAQTIPGADGNSVTIEPATITAAPAASVALMKETLKPDAYLQLFTMHASVMIFFVIIPMLVGGFGNFLIPLMIGARDMAFPKLNMLSFWLAFPSGILMLISFWTANGPAAGGWTMYPTLSSAEYSPNFGATLWLVGVALVGFSSIVGGLNYITTVINMRAPGLAMFRMPLTVWALFITSILGLFSTPVLTAALIMQMMDRLLGTVFFVPQAGGQPLMWQHLFWFYSHPAVYIMILPAMGVVSDILSTFARKPIFGYKPMVFAMAAITGLGFIVWGHHMFQSGMNPVLGTTFMASTIMIAVPSAIKTFNWLGTLWGGNIQFTPAMLNALGFVSMFVIGGLSGIFMASAPVDIYIHDTYFIVAHIHYVLFGGSIFGIFAGIYYWFPKMFGRQLNQRWGTIHFILTILAFNMTFFTMHVLGIGGHPRRYASIMEYPSLTHLQPLNVFMTLSAMALGMAQIPFFYNFFASLPRKLGRAMVAAFAVALFAPAVIGLTYWGTWAKVGGPLATLFTTFHRDFPPAPASPDAVAPGMVYGVYVPGLLSALLAGALFAIVAVALVFAVWFIGGALKLPAILARLLYVVTLPLFLLPFLIKQDAFLWLGAPTLHHYWPLLLGLSALPGLAWLALARPRDDFGAPADANPWLANSLEWMTSSPPPFHNFDEIPVVYRGPYEFSSPVVREDYLPQPTRLPPGVVEPTAH